jgi:hypothetical protein
MKKFMMVALGAAVLALVSSPSVTQAQVSEAIKLTSQGVVDLTDYPAQGKRYTVDVNALGGADVRQIKKATGQFQDALNKAKSGGADRMAIHELEMAIAYGKATLHKEARLSAEGALYYLCKQNNQDPKETCDKVPKYGSYTAP